MYLHIKPNYEYLINNSEQYPSTWKTLCNEKDIITLFLPITNLNNFCLDETKISTIYFSQKNKTKPEIDMEYILILCGMCSNWAKRSQLAGYCDKCLCYLCKKCLVTLNSKIYCLDCYEYITENDSIS